MEKLLQNYEAEHQDFVNKIFHFFGIPMIIFSLFIFGQIWFPLTLILLGVSCLYLILDDDLSRAIITCLVLGTCLAATFIFHLDNWKLGLAFFIGGWLLQIPGHLLFEKNKPTFLKNLTSFFVAPVWFAETIFCYKYWK